MNLRMQNRASCAIPAVLAAFVIVMASVGTLAQTTLQAEQSTQAETFTATTVNLNPGAGEAVSIHIVRWSTDADRERLATAFTEKGGAGLQADFEAAESLGIIWTGENLGYSVRYAHRVALPDGGERIIAATDRRLGVWTRGNLWKATGQQTAPDYPFTLVELRLNRRGQGQGKLSLATKVTVEQEGKTIALENYSTAPVLLKDVKRERLAAASTS
jgi:hypothetical protein